MYAQPHIAGGNRSSTVMRSGRSWPSIEFPMCSSAPSLGAEEPMIQYATRTVASSISTSENHQDFTKACGACAQEVSACASLLCAQRANHSNAIAAFLSVDSSLPRTYICCTFTRTVILKHTMTQSIVSFAYLACKSQICLELRLKSWQMLTSARRRALPT